MARVESDVVVVGGGVAGLTAASELARAGMAVSLLEARERLGGRIWTVRDDRLARPIELGAEFVHGESVVTWDLIRRSGIQAMEVPQRHEIREGGALRPLPDLSELLDRVLALDERNDQPFAALLDRALLAHVLTRDDVLALRQYVEGFHAADIQRAGSRALADTQQAEARAGERQFRLRSGYDAIVRHLADDLTDAGVDTHLGCHVTEVHWQTHRVVLEADMRGSRYVFSAPRAVVTVPLSLLKRMDGEVPRVRVDPMPQSWSTAFDAIEMGAVARVVLQFHEAWWTSPDGNMPSFLHGRQERFPVWWTLDPTIDPLLTGWIGGPRAEEIGRLDMATVLRLALDSASAIFAVSRSTLAEKLVNAYYHNWLTDPYARGAYSYGGLRAAEARASLGCPVDDTLWLAGEAIASDGTHATVHGAMASGHTAATSLAHAAGSSL